MTTNTAKQLFIAGFHGNDAQFTELYRNQDFSSRTYIKLAEASEVYQNGENSRLKGEKCICEHCLSITKDPFIWTRDYMHIDDAISKVLNKSNSNL